MTHDSFETRMEDEGKSYVIMSDSGHNCVSPTGDWMDTEPLIRQMVDSKTNLYYMTMPGATMETMMSVLTTLPKKVERLILCNYMNGDHATENDYHEKWARQLAILLPEICNEALIYVGPGSELYGQTCGQHIDSHRQKSSRYYGRQE